MYGHVATCRYMSIHMYGQQRRVAISRFRMDEFWIQSHLSIQLGAENLLIYWKWGYDVFDIPFPVFSNSSAEILSRICEATLIQHRRLYQVLLDNTVLVDYCALWNRLRILSKEERSVGEIWKNHAFLSSTRHNFLRNKCISNPKTVLCSAYQGESSGIQHVFDNSISVLLNLSADVSSRRCKAASMSRVDSGKNFSIVVFL